MTNSEIIVAFIISFGISVPLSLILIKICNKYSFLDFPSHHKRHRKPTPNLGGTGIFISVWVVIGLFIFIDQSAFEDIRYNIGNIFAGSLLIYIIGLIDDIKPVSAWTKLAVQIMAGLLLYFGGMSIDLLSLPFGGTAALNGLSVVITIFWVVALTNAINLIDGLDGLASGVSLIAAVSLTVVGVLHLIDSVTLISIALTGALAGFLIFNRYPAKIFLGDSGSLLIGYFFAVISLVVPIKSFTTAALFLPLLILAVPLIEAFSSFVRRLAAGKNVMKADRRHIFHYLSHAGLTHKQIVTLFYLTGFFFGLIAIAMSLYQRILVLTILVLFMVVIFIIYFIFMSRIRKKATIR